MISRNLIVGALFATVAVAGCSRTDEYSPEVATSAEDIFQGACISCHEMQTEGDKSYIFKLTADTAKPAVIAEKITKGSLMMPGFPNIKGEQLAGLSQFVITNSKVN